jgi:hypothetical protein
VQRLLQLVHLQRLALLLELHLPPRAKRQHKPPSAIKCCPVWATPCLAPPVRAVVNAKAWRK